MDLEQIPGIGPKTAEILNKLDIHSKDDLITYYPYRYEVLRRSDINKLSDGDKIIIDGIVEGQPTLINLGKKLNKIIFRIRSKNYVLNVTVYNQTYLCDVLKYGKEIYVIGKYNRIKNCIVASSVHLGLLPDTPKIESIYHANGDIKSKSISKYIHNVLDEGYHKESLVPDYIANKYYFDSCDYAIEQIHRPLDIMSLKKARQRLKYEELFTYLLKINYLKKKINDTKSGIVHQFNRKKIDSFIGKLDFSLSVDQKICVDEILSDMSSTKIMNRLLQGDVGSGKTIVAMISMYASVLSGYQAALMVPLEILALQHYNAAIDLFKEYDINVKLLTSSVTKKQKELILKDLKNGEVDIIIGTQSLIQDSVEFKNLGLIITDEQHRFGVNQRSCFKNKGLNPDILSMSATPIPRTYALSIYGDMDISSIKTKPFGRKDVITYFKKEKDVSEVLELMKEQLDKKHQIFVIAPAIENEKDEVESVKGMEEKMQKAFGKVFKISSVHGKQDSKIKNKIMTDFENGKIDILISTTVIEVGVNIKNASMIVIFDANMFGLSTLHQLRGRVGRSDIQSYCVLIAKETSERLKMLEKCNDGFLISEYDFKNRGEGDIFGVRQSGNDCLKLVNLKHDFAMLQKVKDDVEEFVDVLFNNENGGYSYILDELCKFTNLS